MINKKIMKKLDRVESKAIEMLTAEFPSIEEQKTFFEMAKIPENKNSILGMIANHIHKKVQFQLAIEDGVCLINDMEKVVKNVYEVVFSDKKIKLKNEFIEEAKIIEETEEGNNPKKEWFLKRLFKRKKS